MQADRSIRGYTCGYTGRMTSVQARRWKNGDVTFRVQFRIDGKVTSDTFLDAAEADQFARLVDRVGGKTARQIRDARDAGHDVPTLAEWTAEFLDPTSGLLGGVTDGTRHGYVREAARSFLQHTIADLPLDIITEADVTRWVTWQEAQPTARTARKPKSEQVAVSAKTVRGYHALLSAVLGAAVKAKKITSNPAKGTRLSKGRKPQMTFLTPQEYRTVLAFIPDHYRPLVELLVTTGMRWGEATALTWNDIDESVSPALVRIDKAWKKGESANVLGAPKSDKGNRTIALPDNTLAALPRHDDRSALIFATENGTALWPQHFRSRVWHPAVIKANSAADCARLGLAPISKSPRVHDLRHTHASWLINAGVPLPVIQQRLGHENITTTVGTYGHIMPDAQVQVVAAVNRLMLDV